MIVAVSNLLPLLIICLIPTNAEIAAKEKLVRESLNLDSREEEMKSEIQS